MARWLQMHALHSLHVGMSVHSPCEAFEGGTQCGAARRQCSCWVKQDSDKAWPALYLGFKDMAEAPAPMQMTCRGCVRLKACCCCALGPFPCSRARVPARLLHLAKPAHQGRWPLTLWQAPSMACCCCPRCFHMLQHLLAAACTCSRHVVQRLAAPRSASQLPHLNWLTPTGQQQWWVRVGQMAPDACTALITCWHECTEPL